MLELKQFRNIYRGKRILVTGHTGFKGSWLCLWLKELGAKVSGVSITCPTEPNHWDLLKLNLDDFRQDIRDTSGLVKLFKELQPEVVFHLAAQSLVRRSYADPLEAWSTNVVGTASVLEACRQNSSVKAIIVATTDKCYENREWHWGYRETDLLGGHDPYSASKAGSELVAASYRSSFFLDASSPLLATARAGNVIGGGDWSDDRLIPDLVRAIDHNKILKVRSPNAIRPWQHVLEALCGYLLLGQSLLEGKRDFSGPWNFGPRSTDNCSVSEVINRLNVFWPELACCVNHDSNLHETTSLYLDSAKARNLLNWETVWDMDQALEKTANWYRSWMYDQKIISQMQLVDYIASAQKRKVSWVN